MKKLNLKKGFTNVRKSCVKHSPQILIGVGIVSFGMAVIHAVKSTPRALEDIEEAKEEKLNDILESDEDVEICEEDVVLTPVEVVKATWKTYLPTAIFFGAGIVSVCVANRIYISRITSLALSSQLAQEALREYRDKVTEVVGEKKEKDIRHKVNSDKYEGKVIKKEDIIRTGTGSTLCMDPLTGRPFESDIEVIRKAVNNINYVMINEGYASLNFFFQQIGLEGTELGAVLGWNLDRQGQLRINFDAIIVNEQDPCVVLDYSVLPEYHYDRYVI